MTSSASVNINMNTTGVKELKEAFKKGYFVKVGILGEDNARDDDGEGGKSPVTNAELGLIHEFGSIAKNIPARSFLRAPLQDGKDKIEAAAKSNSFQRAFEAGDMEKALEYIGFAAEDVVAESFETSGGGAWPANKAATVKAKGSSKPLINTSQLRRAISSEVANGEKN